MTRFSAPENPLGINTGYSSEKECRVKVWDLRREAVIRKVHTTTGQRTALTRVFPFKETPSEVVWSNLPLMYQPDPNQAQAVLASRRLPSVSQLSSRKGWDANTCLEF